MGCTIGRCEICGRETHSPENCNLWNAHEGFKQAYTFKKIYMHVCKECAEDLRKEFTEEKDRKIAEIAESLESRGTCGGKLVARQLRALIQKPEEKKPFSCTTGRSFLPPKKPEEKKVK
jgi:hypothetical protein